MSLRQKYLEDVMKDNNLVPIFYACDSAFLRYTAVSINSLVSNFSKDRKCEIYILNSDIKDDEKQILDVYNRENVKIIFVDVKEQLVNIGKDLPLRDYYSKTTYFRLFIAKMFPQFDKAIYIDSDTIVLGDMAQFFDTQIGDNFVGACREQVMVQTDVFGEYVEQVLGIDRNNYFNAGVLLINCKKFREENVLGQFINLLSIYNFVVTQDEDYLNVICEDKVYWIDQSWNTEVYGKIPVREKDIKIIHYIMTSKPWHYSDCRLEKYFWKYAKSTSVYDKIDEDFNKYSDEQRESDKASAIRLVNTAISEINREDRYLKRINKLAQ